MTGNTVSVLAQRAVPIAAFSPSWLPVARADAGPRSSRQGTRPARAGRGVVARPPRIVRLLQSITAAPLRAKARPEPPRLTPPKNQKPSTVRRKIRSPHQCVLVFGLAPSLSLHGCRPRSPQVPQGQARKGRSVGAGVYAWGASRVVTRRRGRSRFPLRAPQRSVLSLTTTNLSFLTPASDAGLAPLYARRA